MISFSKFAKEYKIPRSSVYDIVDRLKEEDIKLYERCVVESDKRKELTSEGVDYVLRVRGVSADDINKSYKDNDRQEKNNSTKSTDTVSDSEIIETLKHQLNIKDKQLENKDIQINTLQNNYDSVVKQLKDTNDQLIEISKNQQFLTNQLQNYNMIDKLGQQPTGNYKEVDNSDRKKKGFWKRLFG